MGNEVKEQIPDSNIYKRIPLQLPVPWEEKASGMESVAV